MCLPDVLKKCAQKTEAGRGAQLQSTTELLLHNILAARDQETTVSSGYRGTPGLCLLIAKQSFPKSAGLNHEIVGLEGHQGEIKIPYRIWIAGIVESSDFR